jgi:putative ABC transport system permease protein
MTRIWRDVRQASRVLWRGRGVSALAVLAFALGIGVTTAVFSIFYGVLLKPLPYPDPQELVSVYDTQPACSTCPASYPKYIDWHQNTVLAAMGGSSTGILVVTGDGEPERVSSVTATASLVNDVFRVSPAMGRWFTEDEDDVGGARVAVLSHGFWLRRYAGDPGVLGRTITLGGGAHEIVGVMPEHFSHRRGEVFVPLQREFDPTQRGNHFLATYGRLKAGVTRDQAQREMVALGGRLAEEFGHNHGIDVRAYHWAVVGNVEGPLRVLMGGVALVLLIAAANVANLLLASGLARRRELAVRAALGATRWDLARQLATESLLLSLAGGALGLLLAQWAVSTFVAMAASILPRTASLAIDGWVVLFAAGVTLVTGVLCGLWSVARLGTKSLAQGVREGDLRSGDAGGQRFGNGLVVAEVAIAFSLLVGAGLLTKSLSSLQARETGFDVDRIVAFDVAPTGARYAEEAQVNAFYHDLLPRLAALPGVESVGVTSHLPMYSWGWNGEVTLDSGNPWPANEAPLIEYRWIGGDYFQTMGIELVRGRLFNNEDRADGPLKTVISQATAEKFWPGQDPIGRSFSKGSPSPTNPTWEVIGVVANVRSRGIERATPYESYASIEQQTFGAMTVAVRTAGSDPLAAVDGARQAVKSIDPLLPISQVQTMSQVVSESANQPRLLTALAVLFGVMAGVLAAVGVYGVMAYNVRRERREFGVRLALGADPGRVRLLIVRRGLVLGAAGVALGAAGAWALTRTMQSMLSDVEPTDPVVFAGSGVLLLVIAVAAVAWPARQAARTDPMVALRQ